MFPVCLLLSPHFLVLKHLPKGCNDKPDAPSLSSIGAVVETVRESISYCVPGISQRETFREWAAQICSVLVARDFALVDADLAAIGYIHRRYSMFTRKLNAPTLDFNTLTH